MKKTWPIVLIAGLAVFFLVMLARSGGLGPKVSNRPGDEDADQGSGSTGDSADGGGVVVIKGEPRRQVLLEAEDAAEVIPPVSVVDNVEGASGGRACYLGPEKINESPEIADYAKGFPGALHPGYARLKFSVPRSGNYKVWVRARWSDDCGDSLDVAVNGNYLGTIMGNAGRGEPVWHWYSVGAGRNARSVHLEENKGHTISICNREDDLHFDQILIIDAESRLEPVGIISP